MCPPGLHISLGVFYRLYTLLEEACHELDLLSAQQTTAHLKSGGTFDAYCVALRNRQRLKEQSSTYLQRAEELEQLASLLVLTASQVQVDTSQLLDAARTQAVSYREKVQQTVN